MQKSFKTNPALRAIVAAAASGASVDGLEEVQLTPVSSTLHFTRLKRNFCIQSTVNQFNFREKCGVKAPFFTSAYELKFSVNLSSFQLWSKDSKLEEVDESSSFQLPRFKYETGIRGSLQGVRAEFFGFLDHHRTDEKVLPRLPRKTQEHRVTAAC